MTFIKNTEDFGCEKCGFFVVGTGYTNHCPRCLWSKHVDIHPGDRLESCCGMMKPIDSEVKDGEEGIIHQCTKCGKLKKNKLSKEDNYDTVIELVRNKK